MWSNTKLLTSASLSLVIFGFLLLWFGFKPSSQHAGPSPSPIIQANISSFSDTQATPSAIEGIEGERAYVIKVVDGDTVELQNGKKVRLLGIDTPETVDPRRPVECFGKEASNETKSLLTGKAVILQKDISETDKYNRLLRFVFLPLENSQLLFINDYLVRKGFAKAKVYPPDVKFSEQFKQAETEAKESKRGLWGRC